MLIKMCIATCNVLWDCWLAFIYIIFCCQLFFHNFFVGHIPTVQQLFRNTFFLFAPWVFVKCSEFFAQIVWTNCHQMTTRLLMMTMTLVVAKSVGIGHFWRVRKRVQHFWHFFEVIKSVVGSQKICYSHLNWSFEWWKLFHYDSQWERQK